MPEVSSQAVTCASPKVFLLMGLSRSPTVSLPVDLYVVVLVPSLTVIAPVATIPKVTKDVLALNGTVPVPVAGSGAEDGPDVDDEFDDEDEEDEPELVWDELVLLEPPVTEASALCTAALSWELTRLSAVWFAMLAKPADSEVEALNILLMTALLCACDWLALAARAQ